MGKNRNEARVNKLFLEIPFYAVRYKRGGGLKSTFFMQ